MFPLNKKRAANGTRTRDLDLGKVALYQLSYFRIFQYNKNGLFILYCGCKFNTLIQLHKRFLQKKYRQNITF